VAVALSGCLVIARVEWGFDMRMRGRTRALALAVVLTTAAVAGIAVPASATSYPSWSDVQKARSSASAKAAEVKRIEGLLAASQAVVQRTEKVAQQRGAEYQAARDQVDAANDRLDAVKAEVAADQKRARAASRRAGLLAAQLSRTGGTDVGTTLFFSGGSSNADASSFLTKLGRLSKLTQSNGAIAAEAKQTQRTAAATQARLKDATTVLVGLKQKAAGALAAAVKANDEANAELQKEQDVQATLSAQLKALQAKSASEFAGYQAGVRAKAAAAAAARRAAAARAAAAAGGGGGGGGGSVGSSGWALPAYGPITDGFGFRPDRPAGANPFHRGTDIGAGCGSSIYAAHSGTVIYASPLGTYGNFIEIDNGGGVSTGYAHIRPGGTFVHVGEHVSSGENIASVGMTGAATGCHLHFEVRINEVAINSVPFMAARGVTIG
jgi:murein DD-endopeptidase MepM/ murein hydrolase activator NlpD